MKFVEKKYSRGEASHYINKVMAYFAAHPRRRIINLKTKGGVVRVRKTHIEHDINRHAHSFVPNRPR